eukprot:jgi/Mesvir1/18268/Mv09537-RA.1
MFRLRKDDKRRPKARMESGYPATTPLARKQLEKSKAQLARHLSRPRKVLKYSIVTVIAIVIAIVIVAAILLRRVEVCRFPNHARREDFRYTIRMGLTNVVEPQLDGSKLVAATGGQLDKITLLIGYGSVEVVADPDPERQDILIQVTNRAKDKGRLGGMSTMTVSTLEVPILGSTATDTKFNLTLVADTSNSLTGASSCQRADVRVVVPSTCLMEETELFVEVAMGDITTSGLRDAPFRIITLKNEQGSIRGHELQAERLNLNTSDGTLDARAVTAHQLFMLSRREGKIRAKDVRLMAGSEPTSCRARFEVQPGFPEYSIQSVVCDQVLGTLTVDSRGREGTAVQLEGVSGGHITSRVRVGETKMKLTACDGFRGNYTLMGKFSTKEIQLKNPRSDDEGDPVVTVTREPGANHTLSGTLQCPGIVLPPNVLPQTPASAIEEFALFAESITTGDITIEITVPPAA